ncbi:uncharacterized protein MP3633_3782 [Marinomonas primoryensis]|uniref:Uncharacterized protein n=1 Tax=Marinomonas primoryensis TaxID=178399 RepID=A0A859D663_9GAMM|nr:uncharacterized protein MP3633_3782 [Marinomonas primoryensis]
MAVIDGSIIELSLKRRGHKVTASLVIKQLTEIIVVKKRRQLAS